MSEPVLDLDGVEKTYRFFRLSAVGLRLEAGQIMGFVGPNGAGKSTTIRIIMGMIRPDRGTVRVLGHPIPAMQAEAKRDVGFVSEDMRLHTSLSLAWHMKFVASIYPGWDAKYADLLLQRFNLHPDQAIKVLSHGERVKAILLLVLARRPRLLLLDEPTTGLDPVARHEVLTELMDVVQIFLPMLWLSGLFIPLPKFLERLAVIWPAFHLNQMALGAAGVREFSFVSPAISAAARVGFTVMFGGLAIRRLARRG